MHTYYTGHAVCRYDIYIYLDFKVHMEREREMHLKVLKVPIILLHRGLDMGSANKRFNTMTESYFFFFAQRVKYTIIFHGRTKEGVVTCFIFSPPNKRTNCSVFSAQIRNVSVL